MRAVAKVAAETRAAVVEEANDAARVAARAAVRAAVRAARAVTHATARAVQSLQATSAARERQRVKVKPRHERTKIWRGSLCDGGSSDEGPVWRRR